MSRSAHAPASAGMQLDARRAPGGFGGGWATQAGAANGRPGVDDSDDFFRAAAAAPILKEASKRGVPPETIIQERGLARESPVPRISDEAVAFLFHCASADERAWCLLGPEPPAPDAPPPEPKAGVPPLVTAARGLSRETHAKIRQGASTRFNAFIDARTADGATYGIVAHPFYDELAPLIANAIAVNPLKPKSPRVWRVDAFHEESFTRKIGENIAKRSYAVFVAAYCSSDPIMYPPPHPTSIPVVALLVYWGNDDGAVPLAR